MATPNRPINRRDVLASAAVCTIALPTLGCTRDDDSTALSDAAALNKTPNNSTSGTRDGDAVGVHYLEVVTPDVDAACALYSAIHGVKFGDTDASRGGARVAQLTDGGMMGIRAPMHDGEKPVTRAYMLVDDIEAAVAAAKKSGAEIAVPPMEIPGHGKCAIYFQGGIEAGLWQL
jgi:predicted enzyme related to lactoylglutathione lyase